MKSAKSNIFCPNCGAGNAIEYNFCRFCGLNLQETAQSLVTQLASGQNAGQLKKLEWIKKLSDFVSLGLTIIIATGILVYLYSIFYKTSFSGAKIFLPLIV